MRVDEYVLCCTPTTRNNRKIRIPTRKTPWENHFRVAVAISENGGFRQNRLPEGPGSPIQSRNRVGDAKNAFEKLLPVRGRHLGKWPLSTNSYSVAPPQPETIEKSRFRREKRPGKTTSGLRSPSWKMAEFDRFGFREAQAVRFDREITTATRKSPFYKHLKHDVTSKSHFRVT